MEETLSCEPVVPKTKSVDSYLAGIVYLRIECLDTAQIVKTKPPRNLRLGMSREKSASPGYVMPLSATLTPTRFIPGNWIELTEVVGDTSVLVFHRPLMQLSRNARSWGVKSTNQANKTQNANSKADTASWTKRGMCIILRANAAAIVPAPARIVLGRGILWDHLPADHTK